MSLRYKGALLSATPPTTSTTSAPGEWTLQQQFQAQAAGTWPFGGPFTYIEDVFSTYLYTTDGTTTQAVQNGINLSTYGGLVWEKPRSAQIHAWSTSTLTGYLQSNSTSALTGGNATFTSNGYTMNSGYYWASSTNIASWTFRKQPKFFDVVTWTGTGSTSGRTITHNLGSVPGCIIVKNTTSAEDWYVYPASLGNTGTKQYFLILNSTAAQDTGGNGIEKASNWTSTQFAIASGSSALNGSGQTYVAYLFASNAGGFGLTGTDNVISCGSTVSTGGVVNVNLGYEPQWLLMKNASNVDSWYMYDTMRGMSMTDDYFLKANSSNAESNFGASYVKPTATGFSWDSSAFGASGETYIYIAIRRGPMKVPTSGTSVFSPYTTAASTGTAVTTNFPIDFQLYKYRDGVDYFFDVDRLRGVNSTTTANSTPWLDTTATTAEATATNVSRNWGNTGFEVPGIVGGASNIFYSFQRAPGFFDEVCWTGDGTANRAITHNLTVAPELLICKSRSVAGTYWRVLWTGSLANSLNLNTNGANIAGNAPYFFGDGTLSGSATAPTATNFYVANEINQNTKTIVGYLFASCPGVSKVGSYSGTGATQTINCGFTGGARFVLIKRTDSTGDWYVWDTARGMVSGTDPSLLLNSTAAEVNANSVYTTSVGFQIVSTAAGINASGGTYIYLAIA